MALTHAGGYWTLRSGSSDCGEDMCTQAWLLTKNHPEYLVPIKHAITYTNSAILIVVDPQNFCFLFLSLNEPIFFGLLVNLLIA